MQRAGNGGNRRVTGGGYRQLVTHLEQQRRHNRHLFPPHIAAALLSVDFGQVLYDIMDLNVPNLPECAICEDLFGDNKPEVCSNCGSTDHAINRAVHLEKVQFFSRYILELSQNQDLTAEEIFQTHLLVAVLTLFLNKEVHMADIEQRRHELLVERMNRSGGDMSDIDAELDQLDEQESDMDSSIRRARRSLFRVFGGARTFRYTRAVVEQTADEFADYVRTQYPNTVV